jgi:putative nucleotide binding protein
VEEYAYILDYMPQGIPGGNYSRKEPVCYAVGDEEFKLFELVPKKSVFVGDRVYIGKDSGMRTEIDHVKRRISAEELSRTADAELEFAVDRIVTENQERYVRFYNEAEAINLRKHLLEELPGLGKKTLEAILDERRKGPFKDMEDLGRRAKVKNPDKLIVARVLMEIRDPTVKRYLFVAR